MFGQKDRKSPLSVRRGEAKSREEDTRCDERERHRERWCASQCAIDHKKLAMMKVTFERESLGSSRVNLFLL